MADGFESCILRWNPAPLPHPIYISMCMLIMVIFATMQKLAETNQGATICPALLFLAMLFYAMFSFAYEPNRLLRMEQYMTILLDCSGHWLPVPCSTATKQELDAISGFCRLSDWGNTLQFHQVRLWCSYYLCSLVHPCKRKVKPGELPLLFNMQCWAQTDPACRLTASFALRGHVS